ncbi:MAG: N-acetylmuramoyl-L-alanine amidase [Klebsiella sp.]|uniref:N-acetylmuramoyl-L-alanine amidase n=1 Tax=Enterobacteriaceae TaxID=543 RepID=UPI0039E62344
MPLTSTLKKGSQDPYVIDVQHQLIALGFPLPRFGADGVLGDETLTAYGAFLISQGLRAPTDELPKSITPSGTAALESAFNALSKETGGGDVIDERNNHPHAGRSVSKPYRKWSDVTAIVLHQTAASFGEKAADWHDVHAHLGVTRKGKIIQLYSLTEICNHANGLNSRSVGIEIDGWYAGIEGKPNTLWQPNKKNPTRTPMNLPTVQADAVKKAITLIIGYVAANNGKITHIHPHRQASDERQSDPGSLIWQTLGIWAQETLNLSDGGANFKVGTGLTIPKEWDARYVNNKY